MAIRLLQFYQFMKLQRRYGLQSNQDDKSSTVLPPIVTSEFSSKIDDLLNKVDIQNRYANRISQCNSKNMEELQKARKQLHRIAEEKKMKELRGGSQGDLVEQMMRRANSSQEELKEIFKELVDAKREIKSLKKDIGELKKTNLQLQRQIIELKRQKYYQMSVKEQKQSQVTAAEVKTFLSSSPNVHTPLYQYCLQVFKKNDYEHFLMNLEKKLNGEQVQQKREYKRNKSHSNQYHFTKARSGIKLKLSRKRQGRLNTQHIESIRIHS